MKTYAKRLCLVLAATVAASSAFAASHAMELQKSREDLMKVMGQNLGTLGKMAKGEMDFDASVAGEAATALHDAAVKVTADEMWEEGTDITVVPEGHALPAIWENFEDFQAKGAALVTASEGAMTASGESLQAVQAAMGEMGQACGACHKAYRAPVN